MTEEKDVMTIHVTVGNASMTPTEQQLKNQVCNTEAKKMLEYEKLKYLRTDLKIRAISYIATSKFSYISTRADRTRNIHSKDLHYDLVLLLSREIGRKCSCY